MKRRLDLALALLHGPRVLFLDEPTTGLDIQSRTALWDEVAHLSRDEGVTVFLTTQYLEEADQLADRLGIIDRGKIVAEGTPRRSRPRSGGRPWRSPRPIRRSARGPPSCSSPSASSFPGRRTAPRCGSHDGSEELANIVRAFDTASVRIANLELHAPSLNDVFLAKTGRSLEGAQAEAAEEAETGEQPGTRGGAGVKPRRPSPAPHRSVQIKELARRSIVRTMRQPAMIVPATIFPLILLAINSAGTRLGDAAFPGSRPTPT